jgi:hypothetical protein
LKASSTPRPDSSRPGGPSNSRQCQALEDVLEQLTAELSDDDTVIFLGDYIDRGPDSKACIDRILAFRAESRAKVVTLLGSHEDWLLRTIRDATRHSWLLGMEAFETIASYSPAAAGDCAVPRRRPVWSW